MACSCTDPVRLWRTVVVRHPGAFGFSKAVIRMRVMIGTSPWEERRRYWMLQQGSEVRVLLDPIVAGSDVRRDSAPPCR